MINKVTDVIFKGLKVPTLFHKEKTDDNFAAILVNNEMKFKFSWRGDNIEPLILHISEFIYGVGVDLNYSIVNVSNLDIISNIELSFFFLDSKIKDNYIYIITELEILKIEKESFTFINSFILPDIFEEIRFEEKKIIVKCMDENIYEFVS